ncbi:MAG: efflux RND transporter permease subunit, partial [Armatimonadota bacterium]
GRSEIGFAAIAITLVDVVVFVPVAFMGGIVGQFFYSFGITVLVATLFSLFMSFTLTPMLASRFFSRMEATSGSEPTGIAGRPGFRWISAVSRAFFGVFDAAYDVLDKGYRRALQWPVRSRFPVRVLLITAGFGMLVGVTWGFSRLGLVKFEFIPSVDEGRIAVQLETPPGTRLEATDRLASAAESIVLNRDKYREVETVDTIVGALPTGMFIGSADRGGNYAGINVKLIDKRERDRSDVDIARALEQELSALAGAQVKVSTVSSERGGIEAPIQLELGGADDDELERTASKLVAMAEGIPGLADVDVSWRTGKPEVRARIDREKAADFGITAAEIARALRQSIAGDPVTTYREAGDEYDVRVRLRGLDRASVADVGSILVGTRAGVPVELRDVADVYRAAGYTNLDRKNKARMVAVTANLSGIVLSDAQKAIVKGIQETWGDKARTVGTRAQEGEGWAQFGPPQGAPDMVLGNVRLHWGGESEMQAESMGRLFFALMLAALFVFMTMSGLFNSMRDPLVIMFTLPMALVGAILALALTRNSISIVSMIGIIMLMGIVGKNAILMVDYTRTLRARGYTRTDAVLEAGPTRMRPVLMTTLATIGGMLPTALALNRGGEWRSPMAIAVIGGLILSTVLTLLMIPIMYTAAEDITDFFRRLWCWIVRGMSWEDTRDLCAK